MTWFTSTQTYNVTIWSEAGPEKNEDGTETPGKGETAIVTMRALNAGDQADIQDILRMEMGDDMERSQLAIGSMRRMSVERSVVDWQIPGPKPTPESIRQLTPEVFEQIYTHVRLGDAHPTSPPAEPEKNGAAALDGEGVSSKSKRTPSSVATE